MKKFLLVILLIMFCTFANADTNRIKPIKQFQYSVTVTDSSTEIISINLKGRDIFIQNNDVAGIVYLNFSTAATATATMLTLGVGESISIPNTTNAVNAIGSIASNANVVVIEGK